MTTSRTTDIPEDPFSNESDKIIADGLAAVQQMREHVKRIERARDEQPALLEKARSDAEEVRGWALIEEPLEGQIKSLASTDGTASVSLPNITARELWGARLCFDLLDCGDDFDQIDAVIGRLFSAAGGDTGVAMVVMSAALSTVASLVVPQMVDELERYASNYDVRVMLAEARVKSWRGRVEDIRTLNDDLEDSGVKPVDSHDIASNAMDPDHDGEY